MKSISAVCTVILLIAFLVMPASGSVIGDDRIKTPVPVTFVLVFLAAGMSILAIRGRNLFQLLPEKITVMIVEDNPDIVEILQLALEKKGIGTMKAFNGIECLEELKKQVPDVLLLDVMMEPMDGWETLIEIRKNPAYDAVPVLMITGKKLTPEEAAMYRHMFHDYIMKPFRLEVLYAAIDNIRERNQKLNKIILLAKQAGIEDQKVRELADISQEININKKVLGILNMPPLARPAAQVDLDILDDMLIVDYINVSTGMNVKRCYELTTEFNQTFKSRGLTEIAW